VLLQMRGRGPAPAATQGGEAIEPVIRKVLQIQERYWS
jgi:hypothetical protein